MRTCFRKCVPFFFAIVIILFLCTPLPLSGCSLTESSAIPVLDSVDDYTWSQLSELSHMISRVDDDQTRDDLKERYHLVNENGQLDGMQFKTVELQGGITARAIIAGFCHDKTAAGEFAGITFFLCSPSLERSMNGGQSSHGRIIDNNTDTEIDIRGGWNASSTREWLNSDFISLLPSDLTAEMLLVDKATITVPFASNTSNEEYNDDGTSTIPLEERISFSGDFLWLPSLTELYSTDEIDDQADENYQEWLKQYALEGSQYELTANTAPQKDGRISPVLQTTDQNGWWLRSISHTGFIGTMSDGTVDPWEDDDYHDASEVRGILPCFSL